MVTYYLLLSFIAVYVNNWTAKQTLIHGWFYSNLLDFYNGDDIYFYHQWL